MLISNGYEVTAIKPCGKYMYSVTVSLNSGIERFDLPIELTEYLYSFTVYPNKIMLYINKEVTA